MTNGAGNVIKLVQLHQQNKPSGIVWVQFDHSDAGQKTRNENRQLYVQGIEQTWTPIKPVTTQFAVGRNKTVQVVRKQFPLRPAAAKTIHRSQGDTETEIVVDFSTRKTIPHIHYVGLSRVTTIEGLHITDLCESNIAVNADVKREMERLRTTAKLKLCISPLYDLTPSLLKLCFLNARSLHRHIEDVRKDLIIQVLMLTFLRKQDLVLKIIMSYMTLLVMLSSKMRILFPIMHQGLMVVQLCIVESHTYLGIHTVTTYVVLKLL